MTSGKQLFKFNIAILNTNLCLLVSLIFWPPSKSIIVKSWLRNSIFLSLHNQTISLFILKISAKLILKPFVKYLKILGNIFFLPIWKSVDFIKMRFAFQAILYPFRKCKQKIKRLKQSSLSLSPSRYNIFKYLLDLQIFVSVSSRRSAKLLFHLP